MLIFDSHTHTDCSHDSTQSLEGLCEAAIAAGVSGIAVTDHADALYCEELNGLDRIRRSTENAANADAFYGGALRVFRGMELSEAAYLPDVAAQLYTLADYDIVIGSVHTVDLDGVRSPYSFWDFSKGFDSHRLNRFFGEYLDRVEAVAAKDDVDVLAHLTCPLRYIVGKYGLELDLHPFYPTVRRILTHIIKRRVALEVNTSGLHTPFDTTMPDGEIIEEYYRLGGRLITLASDAHRAERVACGFAEAAEMLRNIGFDCYHYYEKRAPREASLS